jgi:hypothetical protein
MCSLLNCRLSCPLWQPCAAQGRTVLERGGHHAQTNRYPGAAMAEFWHVLLTVGHDPLGPGRITHLV